MAQDLLQQLAKLAQGTSLGQRTGQRAGAKTKQELDKKEDLATMLIRLGGALQEGVKRGVRTGQQSNLMFDEITRPLAQGSTQAMKALGTVKPGVEGDFQRGLKQAGQEFMKPFEPQDPIQKARVKEAEKFAKEQVRSALEAGVTTPEELSTQIAANPIQTSAVRAPSQIEDQTQLEQSQQPVNQDPLQALAQQLGVQTPKERNIFQDVLRGALLGASGQSIPTKAEETNQMLTEIANRQKILGVSPEQQLDLKKMEFDQLKEEYKQNRLDEREVLKASLKDSGLDDNQITALNAANTAKKLFDLRDRIALKGPVFGPVGSLKNILTGGKNQTRAEYESLIEQFVFDVGALLGQKGRAFTLEEQKLVRDKVIEASLNAKQSAFEGKMQAVFNRINDLAGEEIISLDMMNNSDNLIQQAQSSGQQNQGIRIVSIRRRDENAPV